LAEIYRRTWDKITKTDDIDTVLRTSHYPAIQVWLTALYPESLSKSLASHPKIRSLCCAEYSPELQLQMLDISLKEIRPPVLDIGCGFSAELTKYLNFQNFNVIGFDRFVGEETDFIKQENWLTFHYSYQSWGTIISHMALSNHYRYAVQYDKNMQDALDSVYEKILKSLRIGGCFYYAPGVYELEQQIDRTRFRVKCNEVMSGLTTTKVIRMK